MASAIPIPEKVKAMLKKPMGEVHLHYQDVKGLAKDHKIVSVGDVCTLALLSLGIRPHLAVFDFKYMRRKMDKVKVDILKRSFRNFQTITNRSGTLSYGILNNAKKLLSKGGAILIKGEEDITALAFIKYADKKTLVIYGQPHKGVVVVRQDRKTRAAIEKIFSFINSR